LFISIYLKYGNKNNNFIGLLIYRDYLGLSGIIWIIWDYLDYRDYRDYLGLSGLSGLLF